MMGRFPEKDLRELTDETGAAVNVAALDRALSDASIEIDGYLQGRYPLPLVQPPQLLGILACDIAMYRLLTLRPVQSIEDAKARYDKAIAYLMRVAEGKVNLGLNTAQVPAPEDGMVETDSSDRTFTRESMRGL